MEFYKYHGTGNDFILIDFVPEDPCFLAKKICDRHFGIGADGLIYASKSLNYDFKFNYYNSDGSIAPMCGNGMRCFIKYLIDTKQTIKNNIIVETIAGLVYTNYNHLTKNVKVNLGKPILDLNYPLTLNNINNLEPVELIIDEIRISLYVINLGTIHTIVLNEDDLDIKNLGPKISNHEFFPNQTNVNFVKIINKEEIMVETYERGAMWTLSCGTGVSSSVYVLNKLGLISNNVLVNVLGGKLHVAINDDVILEGPATLIAKGNFIGEI